MFSFTNKTLIVVTGPTASGKSSIAMQLAKSLGAAILSADSRQIYRRMNIGTAKPSPTDLELVQHYFIDIINPDERYSAVQFEREALLLLEKLFLNKNVVIAAGGTGFYLSSLIHGFDDIPKASDQDIVHYESKLKKDGIASLQDELKEKDPEYYAKVDIQNSRRVIRALSTMASTGKLFSQLRTGIKKERPFDIIPICLDVDRAELYERINQRVDEMMVNGLEEEVLSLQEFHASPAMDTVGYREFLPYFNEEYNLTEVIRLIKRNTRRYAKRQMTWFRNQGNFITVKSSIDQVNNAVLDYVKNSKV